MVLRWRVLGRRCRSSVAAWGVGLSVLLAGCGLTGVSGEAILVEPWPSVPPVLPVPPEVGTPFDPASVSYRSVSPLGDFEVGGTEGTTPSPVAVARAVDACMQRRGWDYELASTIPNDRAEPSNPVALVRFREQYGYGLLNAAITEEMKDAKVDRGAVLERNNAMISGLDAASRQRLEHDLGVSPDNEAGLPADGTGCRAKADREVLPGYPMMNPAIRREVADASAAIDADPRHREAVRAWQACMAERGFHHEDPDGARREVSELYGAGVQGDEARARERAVGGADARCAVATTWQVRAELEQAVVERLVDTYGRDATCGSSC